MPEQFFDSIELALVNSVAQANLENLIGDVAETTLDAMTQNGLTREIPIFSFISNIYNGVVAVREQIFLRKIHKFLCVFKEIPRREREEFIERLGIDTGTRIKAGQALILLLDRLDDVEKPELVGRVYRARLGNRISFDEMRRFSSIVDRAFLPDLYALKNAPAGQRLDGLTGHQLEALGLASLAGQDFGTVDGIGAETWYEVNDLGSHFAQIVFTNDRTT